MRHLDRQVGRTLAGLVEKPGVARAEDFTEIAFEVGFNDSNYFTRQFRKTTGLSPRDYRMRRGP